MELKLFTVDSFSDRPFTGNPAAVCLVRRDLSERLDDATMTKIAAEMNLSETAFVAEDAASLFESGSEFNLRWFTPTCEVNLCGHATLATAAVLFRRCNNPRSELRFRTKSGTLKALRNGDEITLDLPLNPCARVEDRAQVQPLITAAVGSTRLEDVQYSSTTKKLLLRFPDTFTRAELENLPVDPQVLINTPQQQGGEEIQVKGVILTVRGTEYDFLSRYFAPWVGIPEDPVTGAAHTVLASYWSEQLGRRRLRARQCSPRGGDVKIEVGEEGERVKLSGQAYIVLEGKMMI